jgi:uncharacterized membrane protein
MAERSAAANPVAGRAMEQHETTLATPHRGSAIVPEKYFRWRAGEITRLEAFCDVVFGFAITLLVVSLEVPRTYAELMADMRGFLPFAACFAQLVMIWRTHYRFSRRYGLEDPYTVMLNMVLLFLVLFYVYPLKFVFTLLLAEITGEGGPANFGWHEGSVLMRVYAAGFASVFLLFALMYAHAYKLRKELALNQAEVLETRSVLMENAILALVGLTSFLMAFRYPEGAGWLYAAIGPLLWINGSIYGKRIRASEKKAPGSET